MQPALRAYARLLPSRRSRAAPGARPYRDPGARPARADEDDDKAKTKTVKETVWDWDLLNDNKALWLRSPADVSEAEYTKFYQALAKARALTLPPPRRRASGTCAPRSRTPQCDRGCGQACSTRRRMCQSGSAAARAARGSAAARACRERGARPARARLCRAALPYPPLACRLSSRRARAQSEYEEPMSHVHFKAEGDVEFRALLYVPDKAPPNFLGDYTSQGSKAALKLYVRRVFISEDFEELIPRRGPRAPRARPQPGRVRATVPRE